MPRSAPLTFLVFLSLLLLTLADDVLLGELTDDAGHGLSGTVYAVDSRTLRIEAFTYDGLGPAGVYWVDEGPVATAKGLSALDQQTCEAVEGLPEFTGEDVVVELPMELSQVGYFSIWCEVVGVSFGGVAIDADKVKDVAEGEPKCEKGVSPPVQADDILLGELTDDADHGLSGTVYAVDSRTLRIEAFTYDGLGPAGVYWVDEGPVATAKGLSALDQQTCEAVEGLPEFTGEDVVVELPMELSQVGYFSIWCEVVGVSFGGVAIDADKVKGVAEGEPKCDKGTSPPVDVNVKLGKLSNDAGHGVAGTVYALNTMTLKIEGFKYDGKGPAAVYWIDEGSVATGKGVIAFDQDTCETAGILSELTGEDVLVELPAGRELSSVGYFSIWCEEVGMSFGGVAVDPEKVADLPVAEPKCSKSEPVADKEVRIGALSNLEGHGVGGTVFALNSRTLRVKNFKYNGLGPAGVFWVGTGKPDGNGAVPLFRDDCSVEGRLPAFTGEDVDLELPNNLELSSIEYLSVWCEQVAVDFGSVAIDAGALKGVPDLESASCVSEDVVESEPFPVEKDWNCEELNEEFQVRWVVDEENLNVELVGRIGPAQYMGFGPSGSDKRTDMIGSDVVIAYQDGDDYGAVDYFINARNPCTAGKGVCPDEKVAPKSGSDDITSVSGKSEGDLTMIRYTRPLSASDKDFDRPISTSDSMFVSWAIGPLNPSSKLPLFHLGDMAFPTSSVSIEFGRTISNACKTKLLVATEDLIAVPGFERPTISGVTEITARIGPPGGTRGYSGITGGPSWGFAWYMSPTRETGKDVLIPAIGVERGKTYTFKVQGGFDDGSGEAFHPLYITSSAMGGFAAISPEERAEETVYAGIEDIEKDSNGGITSFNAPAVGALCDITSTLEGDTDTVKSWTDYFKTLDISCAEDESITSESGKLKWTVPADAPDELYYQCVTHPFLGYKIVVFDEGKVDEDLLSQLNGGGKLDGEQGAGTGDTPEDNEQSDGEEGGGKRCSLVFKGEEKLFDGCRKGLDGDVDVYWTLREADGEIDTLFRAPTEGGYVGFGWGYSAMVGSHVVIAFEDASGEDVIDSYFLEARSAKGVQPNDTMRLVKKDVEVVGDFVAGFFTRKLVVDGVPTLSGEETNAIWAVGAQPSSPTALTKHRIRSSGVFDLSTSPIDDEEDENEEEATVSPEDGDIGGGLSEEDGSVSASPEDEGDATDVGDGACMVSFRGEEKSFSGCQKGLDGDVDVYWKLREADGEIDTLFRAPTEGGYVGFGWGYSTMVGSHVVIAFADASGEGIIDSYFLEARSAEGVQPNDTLKLVEKDVEIEGDFVTGFFTRKLKIDGVTTVSREETTAIWAVGAQPNAPTVLTQHTVRSPGVFDLSAPVINDVVSEDGDNVNPSPEDSDGLADFPEDSEDMNPSPENEDGSGICTISFKGEEKSFDGCQTGLEGDVDVYWKLREADGEIDTLFRAPTEGGYVGFGWGHSTMVGSHVVIAFADASGEGIIDSYFLEARSAEGVQPNDTLKLVKKDVEIEGDFVTGIFTRKLEVDGVPTISNGSTTAIWAVGAQPNSPTTLSQHTLQSNDIFDISSSDTSAGGNQGGSGGDAGDGDKSCAVFFKGQETVFRGCRKNLEHNSEVYWTVRESDGEIDTLFRARTDGYVGFGWGHSEMVGSNVVIALQDISGEVQILDYLLKSKNPKDVQPNSRQRLTNTDVAIDGEYLAGRFTRKLEIEGLPKITNGETDAIWAVGSRPSSNSNLTQHENRAVGTIDISASSGDVSSRGRGAFYIVHGVLMAVAWFVLTPTAIVAMRFFKEFNPLTFQVHRALNVLSVMFVIAAFIMGLSRGSRHYTAHLVIGCIAFSLAILQVLGGVLRPQPRSGARKPWYFVHMLNGYVTHGLGMANVWVGLGVIGADVGYYIACGVLVGLYALVQLSFGVMAKRFPTRVREEQFPDEAEGPAGAVGQGPELT